MFGFGLGKGFVMEYVELNCSEELHFLCIVFLVCMPMVR